MNEEPWFEQEVLGFEGLEGLDEMKELLKTPAQKRAERGIDKFLTSQKQNVEKIQQRKRARQLRSHLRQPLRQESMSEMRRLKDQGYSVDSISSQVIRPQVGKNKKNKLKASMSSKMKQQAKAKAKEKSGMQGSTELDDQFKGKHCRVESETDQFSRYFGMSGFCTGTCEKTQEVTLLTEQKGFTVPAQAVQVRSERECSARPYFSFMNCSYIRQVCMLHEVCGWDPEASYPLEPVSVGKPAVLELEQMRLWFVVLRTTFPQLAFRIIDPGAAIEHKLFQPTTTDNPMAEGIRNAYQANQLLLFPLHCPQSDEHPMGHFTLLAIQGSGGVVEKAQVRYYESMSDLNEICLSKALKVLSILGLPQEGFDRCNQFRQKGAECTEVVMHYSELEVRHAAGEGWGSVLALHPEHRIKMRKTLGRFQSNLEPVRKKWVEKTRLEEVKKACLEQMVEQKVGRAAMIDRQLERLYKLSNTVSAMIQSYDAALPSLGLPKPQPKTKAKAAAKLKSQAKAAAQHPAPDQLEVPEASAGETMPAEEVVAAAEPEALQEVKNDQAIPPEEPPQDQISDQDHPAPDQLEVPEPSAGETMSAEEVVSAAEAEAEAIQELKIDGGVIEEGEPLDADTVQKLNELGAGEVRFSKWLEDLSQKQKLEIIDTHFKDHSEFRNMKRYLQYVEATAFCEGCSKCRYTKCERCTYSKAQNYVLRNASVPYWWKQKHQYLLQ